MKLFLRFLVLTALTLAAFDGFASVAHAQFTYTFFPNNTTINSSVTTDIAIIGYAGGSYDDDFKPTFVSPSSPTIEVVSGANLLPAGVDVFNQSVVNIRGGDIGFLSANDDSTVNVSGGSTSFLLNTTNAVVNMGGGYIGDLEGQGKRINVTGGTVDTLVANVQTDFFGFRLGSCIVDVSGGSIGESFAYNDGILNLRGGNLGQNIYARFGGTVNVFGSGLTASLLNPSFGNTYSQYSLSGVLADGTVLTNKNLFIENDGVTYGHSSFNLISSAPEPGSLALVACGILSAAGLLRRRRKTRTLLCPSRDL